LTPRHCRSTRPQPHPKSSTDANVSIGRPIDFNAARNAAAVSSPVVRNHSTSGVAAVTKRSDDGGIGASGGAASRKRRSAASRDGLQYRNARQILNAKGRRPALTRTRRMRVTGCVRYTRMGESIGSKFKSVFTHPPSPLIERQILPTNPLPHARTPAIRNFIGRLAFRNVISITTKCRFYNKETASTSRTPPHGGCKCLGSAWMEDAPRLEVGLSAQTVFFESATTLLKKKDARLSHSRSVTSLPLNPLARNRFARFATSFCVTRGGLGVPRAAAVLRTHRCIGSRQRGQRLNRRVRNDHSHRWLLSDCFGQTHELTMSFSLQPPLC
jgi:hypothetical protein